MKEGRRKGVCVGGSRGGEECVCVCVCVCVCCICITVCCCVYCRQSVEVCVVLVFNSASRTRVASTPSSLLPSFFLMSFKVKELMKNGGVLREQHDHAYYHLPSEDVTTLRKIHIERIREDQRGTERNRE